jgi:hypothetical protein
VLAGYCHLHLTCALEIFDRALAASWDAPNGGIHNGFRLENSICAAAKYHLLQAESMAAAGLRAQRTGEAKYWVWYDKLWEYCWQHFVDHRQGAWFRILTADSFNLTRERSPAGKVDYHNIGACYDVYNMLSRERKVSRVRAYPGSCITLTPEAQRALVKGIDSSAAPGDGQSAAGPGPSPPCGSQRSRSQRHWQVGGRGPTSA